VGLTFDLICYLPSAVYLLPSAIYRQGMWGDGGFLNIGPNQVPAAQWQPSNFFRTSGDIGASWDSMFQNLQSVVRWQPWRTWRASEAEDYKEWFDANVRTGPGRWAYPDMSVVGRLATAAEDRAHWAAWCIVSTQV
jgi:hypothetical protein